ncbi:hypothetical protein J2S43_002865 [Catenuloplanes nepalensis]|uniref:YCII-related domain-containing protein n=1 Tax=Catenuloplanes nepalensis TaxID=587533 RepID=A0ABT9MSI4_9ACTN|nr:YciI family protein [Catenuloplanes nepalensis]MDP9794353.1 hypothetical protein [Catenuloplanes nepalensis]
MRYLMTSVSTETTPAPDEKLYAAMAAFVEELTATGQLLATGGLAPAGITMTSRDGEITTVDGPFAEAKEVAAGFALVEVATEAEAIELTRRFRLLVGDGISVVQQVFG